MFFVVRIKTLTASFCEGGLMALLFLLFLVCMTALGADEFPCVDPEHHQFDFWLGDWSVYGKDGRLLGSNKVHQIAGGCGIQENWSSAATKNRGTSMNYYDNTTGKWYQTWVDNSGSSLRLEGRFDGNRMILSGVGAVGSG